MLKTIAIELMKALTLLGVAYFLFKTFDFSFITATLISAITCSLIFVLVKNFIDNENKIQ